MLNRVRTHRERIEKKNSHCHSLSLVLSFVRTLSLLHRKRVSSLSRALKPNWKKKRKKNIRQHFLLFGYNIKHEGKTIYNFFFQCGKTLYYFFFSVFSACNTIDYRFSLFTMLSKCLSWQIKSLHVFSNNAFIFGFLVFKNIYNKIFANRWVPFIQQIWPKHYDYALCVICVQLNIYKYIYWCAAKESFKTTHQTEQSSYDLIRKQ